MPRSKEEKEHNRRLINAKFNGIRAQLRDHFYGLDLTEDQVKLIDGRIQLTTGNNEVTLEVYSS